MSDRIETRAAQMIAAVPRHSIAIDGELHERPDGQWLSRGDVIDALSRKPQEARSDLYQRASAEAFAALQQAAIDAIETVKIAGAVIAALEGAKMGDDARADMIRMLQEIPAVRAQRAAQHQQEEQG